jgi:hypothetical protein
MFGDVHGCFYCLGSPIAIGRNALVDLRSVHQVPRDNFEKARQALVWAGRRHENRSHVLMNDRIGSDHIRELKLLPST